MASGFALRRFARGSVSKLRGLTTTVLPIDTTARTKQPSQAGSPLQLAQPQLAGFRRLFLNRLPLFPAVNGVTPGAKRITGDERKRASHHRGDAVGKLSR
jgi:hypothetical protein